MFLAMFRRREQGIVLAFLLVCLIGFQIIVMYSNNISNGCYVARMIPLYSTPSSIDVDLQTESSGLEHIFFLKTHKCGSSTIQNILMRWGSKNALNFVLPDQFNYLGHPAPFNPETQVGKNLTPTDGHFDVFTHHTRFDAANIRRTMPADVRFVTILREPASQFESLFNFCKLSVYYSLPLLDMLNLSVSEMQNFFISRGRKDNIVGPNQMAYDLGMNVSDFSNPNATEDLINMMDEQFDLVMMFEHMEVSLVLLADLMGWPLSEVTYIKLNARPPQLQQSLTEEQKLKLQGLNNVDHQLYQYFRVKFLWHIERYGVERMARDVTTLMRMNMEMMDKCVLGDPYLNPGDTYTKYQLRPGAPLYCEYYIMEELAFTDKIRKKQIARVEVLQKFYQLQNVSMF